MRKFNNKEDNKEIFAALAMISQIGISVVIAVGLCLAAGIGLDNWLGTSPWFTAVFSFLGLGSAINVILRLTSRFVQKHDKKFEKNTDIQNDGGKVDGGNNAVRDNKNG